MKLTVEQIEKITLLILETLVKKELISLKTDKASVLKKMTDVFTADIKAEEDLDREVEGILQKHSASIDTERVDYRRMFTMIKTKLARERGIVL